MATGWQNEIERRLEAVETKVQTHIDAFDAFKTDLGAKLDTITIFVSGANTIFGLARRHWRSVFIFGAGIMTAAGIGNPNVNAFVIHTLGG